MKPNTHYSWFRPKGLFESQHDYDLAYAESQRRAQKDREWREECDKREVERMEGETELDHEIRLAKRALRGEFGARDSQASIRLVYESVAHTVLLKHILLELQRGDRKLTR